MKFVCHVYKSIGKQVKFAEIVCHKHSEKQMYVIYANMPVLQVALIDHTLIYCSLKVFQLFVCYKFFNGYGFLSRFRDTIAGVISPSDLAREISTSY